MKKTFNRWTGLYNYSRPIVKAEPTPFTDEKVKAAATALRYLRSIF